MHRAHTDDGDLLRAAARGDDRAFAEFYRRWLPVVTGYHEPIVLEDRDLERVDELASLGDTRRLDRLLAQLPPTQCAAIRAHVLDERSYAAIAGPSWPPLPPPACHTCVPARRGNGSPAVSALRMSDQQP